MFTVPITIQITVEFCMAFFIFICLAITFLSRKDEPQRSRYIMILLALGGGLMLSDAFGWYYYGKPSYNAYYGVRIANLMLYSIYPFMFIFVTQYFRRLLSFHEVEMKKTWFHGMIAVCTIHILTIIVSQFSTFLYYFDEANVYHRGSAYFIIAVLGTVELIYLATMITAYGKTISRYELIALLSFVLLPFGTNLFQFFSYGLSLLETVSALCMILFFVFHQVEKTSRLLGASKKLRSLTETLEEKDASLTDANVRISISQMQPHFVFNALGSIEQLCRTNPRLAAEATHRFAYYLRTNLIALSSLEMKEFEDELAHIRTYVWLEKMRFGDDFEFIEEISDLNFRVPVLSVQPLVENAIKHGMMGIDEGTLHVKLKTWSDKKNHYIEISDDGAGFEVSSLPKDGKVHVGLNNVRNRIELMCRGTLLIASMPGTGSRFTLVIPSNTDS